MESLNSIFEAMIYLDTPNKYQPPLEESQSGQPTKRELGRWGLKESQRYLEVIKGCEEIDLIR